MDDKGLKRILYVEDDTDIRSVATFVLEKAGGFVIEACASGEEALRKAEAFAPQLLLLDVMMPQMDGPTTLQQLRLLPATQATPVIFMTAKVQPHQLQHYRDLGALDIISKPFDPMTLCDTVRSIWSQHDG